MTDVPAWLSRFVDVRRGELRTLVPAFATLLLLITAHTALETARDAMLLTRLPAGSLGVVYLAVAACALPAAWVASHVTARLGARRALGGGLALAAAAVVVLFVVHTSQTTALALYVTSSLIGAVLVPLYWNLVGALFTVAEGRRLLGPLGAAGVVGGTLGSGVAAAIIEWVPPKSLLLVCAGVLVLTMAALAAVPSVDEGPPRAPVSVVGAARSQEAMKAEPFLRRIALLVVVSTAAMVALDYFFKWTVVRDVPRHEVAPFVARFYLALNALSLVVQLLFSGPLVRRIGATAAMAITPLVLLVGGVGALVTGGALAAVVVLRAAEGMLVNSVHRVATELVYLPVRPAVRARAKPFIDGALVRTTQAAVGALTLAAAGGATLSSWSLAAGSVVLVLAWLAVAVTTWRPYLGLLRRAVTQGAPDRTTEDDPIDLESAEALLEYLAHDEPAIVVGAMRALERRGRERLIPALVLLHEDAAVLTYALAMFGASTREDWVGRARKLLADPREGIRMAAARALAQQGRLAGADLASDASPRVRAYAAVLAALGSGAPDALEDECVKDHIDLPGPGRDEARIGLLLGIADAPRDTRLAALLGALAAEAGPSGEWTGALAKAAVAQRATWLVSALVERLALREGREALRPALVSLGSPAFEEVGRALRNTETPRPLRIHLPNTVARFGSSEAAELLLATIETDGDGLVRYKALRGLGRMVADERVVVDRVRVETLARANLVEHFRLLGLRAPFEGSPLHVPTGPSQRPATERLLVGLLDDKLRQSLERTFRLLKIAHRREDIHTVHLAVLSDDRRARANAAEFLDTLLRRREQAPLRALLRVLTDDLAPRERAARSATLAGAAAPATREEAMNRLLGDRDATVVALAKLHAGAVAGEKVEVEIPAGPVSRRQVALSAGLGAVGGLAAEGGGA